MNIPIWTSLDSKRRTLQYAMCLVACLLPFANAQSVRADDLSDAVAEHLTNESIVAGFVSLEPFAELDGKQFLSETLDVPMPLAEELAVELTSSQQGLKMLRQMGIEKLAAIFSAQSAMNGPDTIFAEVKQGANVEQVKGFLLSLKPQGREAEAETVGQLVVVSSPSAAGKASADHLARFEQSMSEHHGADLFVALIPSDDMLRVAREMNPQVPAPFDQFRFSMLADAVSAAGLSLKIQGDIKLRIDSIAKDDEAAQKLIDAIENAVDELASLSNIVQAQEATKLLKRAQTRNGEGNSGIEFELTSENDGIAELAKAIAPSLSAARDAARRSQEMNNLKQLMLAMHNYHSVNKKFPDRYTVDDSGKPLLSWRVELLPYLDHAELYNEFHHDEPWDSEHNRQLITKMPQVLQSPFFVEPEGGKSGYLPASSEGATYGKVTAPALRDFKDGTSNTIIFVSATEDSAVVWTKPEVDAVSAEELWKAAVNERIGGTCVAAGDGSVRFISSSIDIAVWQALLTIAGGEVVSEESVSVPDR